MELAKKIKIRDPWLKSVHSMWNEPDGGWWVVNGRWWLADGGWWSIHPCPGPRPAGSAGQRWRLQREPEAGREVAPALSRRILLADYMLEVAYLNSLSCLDKYDFKLL